MANDRYVIDERRIMNGTWGEVWLDDLLVGEAYGIQAKCNFNKESVPMCGTMATGHKVTSFDGTGSLKLRKTSSRMSKAIGPWIRNGKDIRFTIISKLDDPDADGAEKVALYGVSFDDLTLADWEAGKMTDTECPFTFSNYRYLDQVGGLYYEG